MSSRRDLAPGGHALFSTRPVGLATSLFIQAGEHDSEAIWHIELCCQPDRPIPLGPNEQLRIDISAGAGALVSIRNTGWASFTTWTDY